MTFEPNSSVTNKTGALVKPLYTKDWVNVFLLWRSSYVFAGQFYWLIASNNLNVLRASFITMKLNLANIENAELMACACHPFDPFKF